MTEMTEAQYPIQLVARPTGLSPHVIRIGASLPAAEIAGSAQHRRARAVALSLVFPRDDPGCPAN